MPRSCSLLSNGCGDNIVFIDIISVCFDSCSIPFFDRDNLPIVDKIQEEDEGSINLPLPEPNQFFNDTFALAFPEVLAWSAAATGILLVVLIVKSFSR